MATNPPPPVSHPDPTPSPTSAFRSAASTRAVHVWDVRTGSLTWCGRTDVFWREFRPPRTLAEWLAAVHPNETDAVERAYQRLTEDRLPVRLEFRVRRPDGRTFPLSAHLLSLSPQTAVACLARESQTRGGLWEEPQRVAAEETTIPATDPTFERFFELSQDLLCVADLTGHFTLVNQAFVRLLGHPMRELLKQPFLNYVHPEDHTATRAEMGKLTREEPVARFRNRYRTASGEYLWLEWNARTVPAERRVFAVARDVTDRLRADAAEAELRSARPLQQRLYPSTAPVLPGFDIAGRGRSASTLCGDYFDFIPRADGKLVLAVGDVCGHGLGPALTMVETRAALRLALAGGGTVSDAARVVNAQLNCAAGDSLFVTLFLAQIDPADRSLRWVGAGHDGRLYRADGTRVKLPSTGVPLGLIDPLELDPEMSDRLYPGDVLVLFTDGLTEAMNPAGEQFGTDRLRSAVSGAAGATASQVVDRVFAAVDAHLAGTAPVDDMTMVVVKVG